MKKFKLRKIIASLLVVASVLALNPIGASAKWKSNSTGWWYTEGSSWATGWRTIDGKWYYFNSNGYMAKDTTVNNYKLGSDGAWIQSEQSNLSNSENGGKVATIDNKNFTINDFINILKVKGYTLEVKDADEDFLSTTRKIITLGNEQIVVYIYNSNKEMEKDSLDIDIDGFGYTITEPWGEQKPKRVSWISYPHFYKEGNIIVQYIGKNEQIISNLKVILGEQFAGIKECSDLSSTEQDIREIAFNQLDSETQKEVKGTWKDSKISIGTITGGVTLNDDSYWGKDAYYVEFILDVNYVPNNIVMLIGMDNHKKIGYGLVD